MKAFRMILVIALLLTIAIPAGAVLCFYDGNEYLKFSESEKIAYVAGLSDMYLTMMEIYHLEKCRKIWAVTEKMTLGQTVKILDRYLEEHPEELHKAVATSFIYAIDEIVLRNN